MSPDCWSDNIPLDQLIKMNENNGKEIGDKQSTWQELYVDRIEITNSDRYASWVLHMLTCSFSHVLSPASILSTEDNILSESEKDRIWRSNGPIVKSWFIEKYELSPSKTDLVNKSHLFSHFQNENPKYAENVTIRSYAIFINMIQDCLVDNNEYTCVRTIGTKKERSFTHLRKRVCNITKPSPEKPRFPWQSHGKTDKPGVLSELMKLWFLGNYEQSPLGFQCIYLSALFKSFKARYNCIYPASNEKNHYEIFISEIRKAMENGKFSLVELKKTDPLLADPFARFTHLRIIRTDIIIGSPNVYKLTSPKIHSWWIENYEVASDSKQVINKRMMYFSNYLDAVRDSGMPMLECDDFISLMDRMLSEHKLYNLKFNQCSTVVGPIGYSPGYGSSAFTRMELRIRDTSSKFIAAQPVSDPPEKNEQGSASSSAGKVIYIYTSVMTQLIAQEYWLQLDKYFRKRVRMRK